MSTLLHELHDGLMDPATFLDKLTTRCTTAGLDAAALLSKMEASDSKLNDSEKCLVLHAALMRHKHAKSLAFLEPKRAFKSVIKDALARAKQRGLKLVKEHTHETPSQDSQRLSTYHTVFHAREVAWIAHRFLHALGCSETSMDVGEFAGLLHDVIQHTRGSGMNELESAMLAHDVLLARLPRFATTPEAQWHIVQHLPYILLETIVHGTTLAKGSFRPLWMTIDDVTTTSDMANNLVMAMGYADLQGACNLEMQQRYGTRIIANFRKQYGTNTLFDRLGLLDDPAFALLFGQNMRMTAELNPFFTADHQLDAAALGRLHHRRRSSISGKALLPLSTAAPVPGATHIPNSDERLFICFVNRVPKEQGFAFGQARNLKEYPRRLRSHGREADAARLEGATDMSAWQRHAETNLPCLSEALNAMHEQYQAHVAAYEAALSSENATDIATTKTTLDTFITTHIVPFVEQALWLSAHQPGAYMANAVAPTRAPRRSAPAAGSALAAIRGARTQQQDTARPAAHSPAACFGSAPRCTTILPNIQTNRHEWPNRKLAFAKASGDSTQMTHGGPGGSVTPPPNTGAGSGSTPPRVGVALPVLIATTTSQTGSTLSVETSILPSTAL